LVNRVAGEGLVDRFQSQRALTSTQQSGAWMPMESSALPLRSEQCNNNNPVHGSNLNKFVRASDLKDSPSITPAQIVPSQVQQSRTSPRMKWRTSLDLISILVVPAVTMKATDGAAPMSNSLGQTKELLPSTNTLTRSVEVSDLQEYQDKVRHDCIVDCVIYKTM